MSKYRVNKYNAENGGSRVSAEGQLTEKSGSNKCGDLKGPRYNRGLPKWLSGKEPACQCRRHAFNPWVRKIPWRKDRPPIPVFLPGESHEQRSLAGYSPWGQKESSMTEQLSTKCPTVALSDSCYLCQSVLFVLSLKMGVFMLLLNFVTI